MTWVGRGAMEYVSANAFGSVFSAVLSGDDTTCIVVLVWTTMDPNEGYRAILSRRFRASVGLPHQGLIEWLDAEPVEIARGAGTVIRGIETTDDGQLLIRLESMGSA